MGGCGSPLKDATELLFQLRVLPVETLSHLLFYGEHRSRLSHPIGFVAGPVRKSSGKDGGGGGGARGAVPFINSCAKASLTPDKFVTETDPGDPVTLNSVWGGGKGDIKNKPIKEYCAAKPTQKRTFSSDLHHRKIVIIKAAPSTWVPT